MGTPLRVQDFPIGYNIAWVPRTYEGISFEQLRTMADSDYITRACIETAKDQLSKLGWRISRKPVFDETLKSIEPHVQVIARSAGDPTVKRLKALFLCPDGVHSFDDWIRMWLEDMLVGDCATLLVGRDDGGEGDVSSFVPADGGMIHVCIDRQGMRPKWPLPAYQQIAKGQIVANLTTRECVYMPRNLRTHRIYGMPPVEQMILFMNLVLRRDISKLSYYTVGNVPEALISAPLSWSPAQIKQFQSDLDTVLSGQLQNRRKMTMIPSLAEPGKGGASIRDAVMFTKENIIKDEFDEWRARVTCFFFSLPPTAFVRQMNRASAQQQQKQAVEEGQVPRKVWIKNRLDCLIQSPEYLDEPDYEFSWEDDEDVEPDVQAKVDDLAVRNGTRSIDELRQRDGLQPLGIGPLIMTPSGPILVSSIKSGDGEFLPGNPPMAQIMAGNEPNAAAGKQPEKKVLPGKKPQAQLGKILEAKKKVLVTSDIAQMSEKVKKRHMLLSRSLARFLTKEGSRIAARASEGYSRLTKQSEDELRKIQGILDELSLDWVSLTGTVDGPLRDTSREAGSDILLELGVSDESEELFGVVNQDALDYAKERGAELVTNISATTEGNLRDLITKAFEDGMSPRDLQLAIEDSFAFSDARAEMIARTELALAHINGALDAAKSTGLVSKKFSMLSSLHDEDDECDGNEEAGEIAIDEPFPSGDDGPPFHPNCVCTLSFVYKDLSGGE
jgi:hypothetical protein